MNNRINVNNIFRKIIGTEPNEEQIKRYSSYTSLNRMVFHIFHDPMFKQLSALNRYTTLDENKIIVFIHIPKTAGTSARIFFEIAFRKQLFWSNHKEFGKLDESIVQSNKFKIYGGHFSLTNSFLRMLENKYGEKNVIYLSILRDPTEQIFSHYKYIQKMKTEHPLYQEGSLINSLKPGTKFFEAHSNLQCGYFSSTRTSDSVLEGLKDKSFAIGTIDDIEYFRDFMVSELGLPDVPYPSSNIGADLQLMPEERKVLEDFVFNYCDEDNELFNLVKEETILKSSL